MPFKTPFQIEMLSSEIDRLQKTILYVEMCRENAEFSKDYPRLHKRGCICPQELHVEVAAGIVAQLPLNAMYFDVNKYLDLFLDGAKDEYGRRCAEYRELTGNDWSC